MGWLGSIVGSTLGGLGGAILGKPGQGAQLGHDFGNIFLPFSKGGVMLPGFKTDYKKMLTGGSVKKKKKKFQK